MEDLKMQEPTSIDFKPVKKHTPRDIKNLGHISEFEISRIESIEGSIAESHRLGIRFDDSINDENESPTILYINSLKFQNHKEALEILEINKHELSLQHKEVFLYLAIIYKAYNILNDISNTFDDFEEAQMSDSEAETIDLPADPNDYLTNKEDMDNLMNHAFKRSLRLSLTKVIEIIIKNEGSSLKINKLELDTMYKLDIRL